MAVQPRGRGVERGQVVVSGGGHGGGAFGRFPSVPKSGTWFRACGVQYAGADNFLVAPIKANAPAPAGGRQPNPSSCRRAARALGQGEGCHLMGGTGFGHKRPSLHRENSRLMSELTGTQLARTEYDLGVN
jgi:hypothetical protein